jgi:hypothetical protein
MTTPQENHQDILLNIFLKAQYKFLEINDWLILSNHKGRKLLDAINYESVFLIYLLKLKIQQIFDPCSDEDHHLLRFLLKFPSIRKALH